MPVISLRYPITIVVALVLAVACSSGTSPSVPNPPPSTTLAPTPTPAATSCPLGYGTGEFSCQGDVPGLLDKLQTAIDMLVASRPDLFV